MKDQDLKHDGLMLSFDNSKELEEYLELLDQPQNSRLIHPLPTLIKQKGNTCKITAVANIMNFQHQTGKLYKKPLPLYKEKKEGQSIRQIAKMSGSSVGEIPDEKTLRILVDNLNEGGFQKAFLEIKRFDLNSEHESKKKLEKQNYIDLIKKSIDSNNPPLIAFDVDHQGFPNPTGDGSREHGAIVVGYFKQEKSEKLFFILGHWGKYFIVDAEELTESAANLLNVRKPATYFKIKFHSKEKHISKWVRSNNDGTNPRFDHILSDIDPGISTIVSSSYREKMKHNEEEEWIKDGSKLKIIKRISNQSMEPGLGFNSTICIIKTLNQTVLNANFNKIFEKLSSHDKLVSGLSGEFADKRGECFGFTMAMLAKTYVPEIKESNLMNLIYCIAQLDQTDIDKLVKDSFIEKNNEKYTLESILGVIKKIKFWQNINGHGKSQRSYHKAILHRRVETLTIGAFSKDPSLMNKLLEKGNLWLVHVRLSCGTHKISFRKEKDGTYSVYDSNIDVLSWIGPFNTLESMTGYLTNYYRSISNKFFIQAVDRLVYTGNDDFDNMLNKLISHLKKGLPIHHHIKRYFSEDISQIELAKIILADRSIDKNPLTIYFKKFIEDQVTYPVFTIDEAKHHLIESIYNEDENFTRTLFNHVNSKTQIEDKTLISSEWEEIVIAAIENDKFEILKRFSIPLVKEVLEKNPIIFEKLKRKIFNKLDHNYPLQRPGFLKNLWHSSHESKIIARITLPQQEKYGGILIQLGLQNPPKAKPCHQPEPVVSKPKPPPGPRPIRISDKEVSLLSPGTSEIRQSSGSIKIADSTEKNSLGTPPLT